MGSFRTVVQDADKQRSFKILPNLTNSRHEEKILAIVKFQNIT